MYDSDTYMQALLAAYGGYLFVSLCASALLAIIPARIAESKGREFGRWYWYGFFLFIVAVIHAASLPYPQQRVSETPADNEPRRKCPQCAEYIKKDAKVCRFCGFDMTPVLEAEEAQRQRDEQALREAEARHQQGLLRREKERQEEEERLAEERRAQEERDAPRRRRNAQLAAAVVLGAVLCVAGFSYIKQEMARSTAYAEARAAFDRGDYANAQVRFDALGDFRDSVTMSLEAEKAFDQKEAAVEYQQGLGALETKDYLDAITHLKKAESLGGYKDSADRLAAATSTESQLEQKMLRDLQGRWGDGNGFYTIRITEKQFVLGDFSTEITSLNPRDGILTLAKPVVEGNNPLFEGTAWGSESLGTKAARIFNAHAVDLAETYGEKPDKFHRR